jgi:NADH dehydrogenase (ubiquinone) Fe-S protein 1
MCLVEDKSALKPQASCALSIVSGMSIYTNTKLVKKAREGVLEFLLINHPLDCPICDQGGECDLQDQTISFGSDRGRFYEVKRAVADKEFGPLIKTSLNRCIHCSRCTRFIADVAGTHNFSLLGRGYTTEISYYIKNFVNSEISGNLIDLCPVGALTSKPFSFKARPWELAVSEVFDPFDVYLGELKVFISGGKILRILPKPSNNFSEWISDNTRFFYDALSSQRLLFPSIRFGGGFLKGSWISFFNKFKNYFFLYNNSLKNVKVRCNFSEINYQGLSGLDVLYVFLGLNSYFGFKPCFSNFKHLDVADFRLNYISPNFDDLSHKKKILIVGLNLRYELPILNLKIKNYARLGKICVYLWGFLSNINFSYVHLGNINLIKGLGSLKFDKLYYSADSIKVVEKAFDNKNAIFKNLNELYFLELGGKKFLNDRFSRNLLPGLVYDYFSDSLSPNYLMRKNLRIFQGSHGTLMANFSDLIAPTSSFLEEKSELHMNIFGKFRERGLIPAGLFLPSRVRSNKDLFYALFEFLEKKSFKKNKSIIIFKNNLKINNYFKPIITGFGFRKNFKFVFKSKVNDFYKSNYLTRLSPVLNICSKEFTIFDDFKYIIKKFI